MLGKIAWSAEEYAMCHKNTQKILQALISVPLGLLYQVRVMDRREIPLYRHCVREILGNFPKRLKFI